MLRRPLPDKPSFRALYDGADSTHSNFNRATFDVRDRLAALALQYRLPMIVQSGQAYAGGLLSYGPNVSDLFRRTAELVDRILRGANPADIPVEQPNVYDFVVNLRTARALGVVLPRSVLLQATSVIG